MTTEADCRQAGEALLGQRVARVRYVGLAYDNPDDPDEVRWDYGDWHWPEVGVELTTSSGRVFHAIWDAEVTQFELRFAEGPISEQWSPLQEGSPQRARVWDVTAHPRWRPLIGAAVEGFDLVVRDLGNPGVPAPLAIRLRADTGAAVWIVAGAPTGDRAREDLDSDDVFLGHDEIIVVFADARADRIGVRD